MDSVTGPRQSDTDFSSEKASVKSLWRTCEVRDFCTFSRLAGDCKTIKTVTENLGLELKHRFSSAHLCLSHQPDSSCQQISLHYTSCASSHPAHPLSLGLAARAAQGRTPKWEQISRHTHTHASQIPVMDESPLTASTSQINHQLCK